MTHTAGPGPWKAIYEHDSLHADGNHIAGVQDARGNWVVRYDDDYGTGAELGPNTTPIAAAPDLLAALTQIAASPEGTYRVDPLEYAHNVIEWCRETASAAIAAARGAEVPA